MRAVQRMPRAPYDANPMMNTLVQLEAEFVDDLRALQNGALHALLDGQSSHQRAMCAPVVGGAHGRGLARVFATGGRRARSSRCSMSVGAAPYAAAGAVGAPNQSVPVRGAPCSGPAHPTRRVWGRCPGPRHDGDRCLYKAAWLCAQCVANDSADGEPPAPRSVEELLQRPASLFESTQGRAPNTWLPRAQLKPSSRVVWSSWMTRGRLRGADKRVTNEAALQRAVCDRWGAVEEQDRTRSGRRPATTPCAQFAEHLGNLARLVMVAARRTR